MPHNANISLGSNIDKEKNMAAAMELLVTGTTVLNVSSVYETVPVGLTDQETFLNAAVKILTPLTPGQLKQGLLSDIEHQLNRVRQDDKNAPRTIDLDISWFDDAQLEYVGQDGRLRQIPDPDLLRYAHVAVPVAELLASDVLYPGTNESVQSISNRLWREAQEKSDPTIWKRMDLDLTVLLPPELSDDLPL